MLKNYLATVPTNSISFKIFKEIFTEMDVLLIAKELNGLNFKIEIHLLRKTKKNIILWYMITLKITQAESQETLDTKNSMK